MPITTRKTTPPSLLQQFRAFNERLMMDAAQEDMWRKYPDACARPPRPIGLLRPLLRAVFVPLFRLTPYGVRRWLMQLIFVRPPQRWAPAAPLRPKGEDKA